MHLSNPKYPVLGLLVSYGDWLAVLVAALPIVAGIALCLSGGSALWIAGGIAGGAFLYLIMRSYVELVRVIVEMLLPQ